MGTTIEHKNNTTNVCLYFNVIFSDCTVFFFARPLYVNEKFL